MAKTTPTTATTRPEKPDLNTEVASRLRDPFEPIFMGVVRPNDPLLGEHGNNWQIYRDLKRDGKVFSGLQKRILALISRPWTVQPADGKSTSDAEAVQAILGGFNFDRLCSDMMEALIVGFSPAEVIWMVSDNLIVPARVVKRAQRRFTFVQDDDTRAPQLRLLTQADMIRGEALEERKFIVHRVNPEDDNPYGTGLGLQLYWPVFFKRKGIIAWNKMNDRFGTPTPWGKYPRNASQKEKNTLFDALRAFSSDGVVMTAEGTLIELLETKLSGSVTTQQSLCEYMDDWIDSVLLGTEARSKSGGAMAAASKERQDVRLELTQADSDLLSETLNETLIKWICEYNGFSRCLVYREIKGEEDKKAESETDKNVSEMGFELSLDAVRAKYGDGWEKKTAPVEPQSPENGKPAAAGSADETQPQGTGSEDKGSTNEPETKKFDASMINAYSMGVYRFAEMGMDIPQSFVRDIFSIPKAKAGEPLLIPQKTTSPAAASFAEPSMTDDLQQAIVDTLAAASTGPIDTWLKQIEDMVRHASDLPSLQEQLLTAFGDLPENDLAELMGLAYTAARLAGMASAVDDGQ